MTKIMILFSLAFIFSCNQPEKKEDHQVTVLPEKKVVVQDTLTASLGNVVQQIEKNELQQVGILKRFQIDSVQYKMISLKEYYTIQKSLLEKGAHFSTNKEKTQNALAYLGKMIAISSAEQNMYCVQFHLNALLASDVVYNENHTKYLKKDRSEMQLRFP